MVPPFIDTRRFGEHLTAAGRPARKDPFEAVCDHDCENGGISFGAWLLRRYEGVTSDAGSRMNKPKKAELMAEIGSFKAEKIVLNEQLTRYQAELAAARERISSMEERISSMEERFELIAVLAAPREAE
jgi:hypothetical protein